MENMNVNAQNAQNAAALPVITAETTLGELLAMLNLGEKPPVPTPRELFETLGAPIADMNDCTLFSNGFAIYQNCTGRTVVWLPYCTSFTYYFGKLRDSEKDTLTETYELPEGFLETQPWVIAVTLIGDHRIEHNSMNRMGSRKDTIDFASKDNGDKDGAMEEVLADPYRRAFNWYDGHMGGPMSIKWTEKGGELSNEKFSSNRSKAIVMRVWTERVVETMDVSKQSILQFR